MIFVMSTLSVGMQNCAAQTNFTNMPESSWLTLVQLQLPVDGVILEGKTQHDELHGRGEDQRKLDALDEYARLGADQSHTVSVEVLCCELH
jgi:hypothetical protein